MKHGLLSVLMPVHNEQAFVRKIVHRVLEVDLPEGLDRELIIVDDGSTDGTSEILAQLGAEHPDRIRVFRQNPNQGKGAAIARAIEEMRGDIAVIQDADLEYDPADFRQLLDPILTGHADVVYGSRFASRSSRRVLNYHHSLGNTFLTHLSNLTTGLNLTDMETCYKVFRADVLRTIPLRSKRFGLEPEITAKVAKRDCVVYEVPINYHGRTYREGKKIGWRDGLEAVSVILKYWAIDDCVNERHGHHILRSLSGARRFTQWMVGTLEPFMGQRILEIGSGIANISRQLPKRERLTLSDVDDEYLRLLEQAFRHYESVDVIRLDLESDAHFDPIQERYDTVLCLNVLEHVDDDVSALRRMASALEPGGRLVVLVPQHESLYSEMDRELGHFRRYRARDLTDKMSEAGLRVVHVQDFNAMGALGWFTSARLLGRKQMDTPSLKLYDVTVPIHGRLERWLPLPGLSVIAVGEKS